MDIRAVDSVALLDPKGAPHDIVQAIGRALRQKPGAGQARLADRAGLPPAGRTAGGHVHLRILPAPGEGP